MAESSVKSFKAVLVGATGATGKYLFADLLKAKEFSEITTLGRRKATLPPESTGIDLEEEEKSGRLKQEIIDFDNISNETVGEYFKGKDVYFSTFGTTRKQAGSAEAFKRIDYSYNYNLAKVAKENNVRLFMLMSSQGANECSFFLYLNSKGKLEKACEELRFPVFSIFRPGLLDRGEANRFAEKVAGIFMSRMPVQTVAHAFCSNAIQHLCSQPDEENQPQTHLYYNDQIRHMSETYLDVIG